MLNLFNFFTMNIILLEHIEKVGAKHDVVKVKDGYGRNYLIPKGLAIVANKPNLARLEGLKKQAAKKEGAIIAAFKEVAAKLAGAKLSIPAKAGESGRLPAGERAGVWHLVGPERLSRVDVGRSRPRRFGRNGREQAASRLWIEQ